MNFISGIRSYFRKEKFDIYREILLSIIISTAVTALFSFYLDRKMDKRVSDRQFIYDFSRTFVDNPKYRNVSIALEEQYLYGREDKLSAVTEYDLDDYLGLLSDMWLYSNEGYISKDLFQNQYYYYLCITYKSPLVRSYRDRLRREGFSDYWIFLDDVANNLQLDSQDCKIY